MFRPIIKQEPFDPAYDMHINQQQQQQMHSNHNENNCSMISLESSSEEDDDEEYQEDEKMDDQQQQQLIDKICRKYGWRLNFAEAIDSKITEENYKLFTRKQTILYDVDENEQRSDQREAESSYFLCFVCVFAMY